MTRLSSERLDAIRRTAQANRPYVVMADQRRDVELLLAHIDALEAERAEMTEEWGRAFWTTECGERKLFVDDDNGAFRDYEDVAQYVPPIHAESPYDFVVSRRCTPWLPVEEDQG
ncbi:hypothetical protein [Cumulibacter soli]|uniref:hypothetical protein n=1 Tax=Cumulibacter soli TaxID=2546344 RepID=UPI001068BF93|nr:hypothetical protein [Cumulibacter soli]